ncbi:DUF4267 domain-containing protein [Nocardioides dongkuii]|uniref:DUF4267 domain-containing protein n=1 Tax=Nocardioides dongkuii TaxID=2760089 RepID=UPI0015FA136E|nr:DUF4267 domain-containing protein [Nocardioides dongkuii]
MNPVTGLSLGRIAIGAVALADPHRAGTMFQLDPQLNPQLTYVTRLFGSREVVLGAATLLATGKARRNLVLLGILVDAADAGTGYLGIQDGSVTQKTGGALIGPAVGAMLAGVLGLRTKRS